MGPCVDVGIGGMTVDLCVVGRIGALVMLLALGVATAADAVAPRVAGGAAGADSWVVGVTMLSVGAGCCWCMEASSR